MTFDYMNKTDWLLVEHDGGWYSYGYLLQLPSGMQCFVEMHVIYRGTH